MEKELSGKLQEIIYKCQAWIDDEKFIPKKFRTQSQSEKFADKILIELEAEMIRQKFSLDYTRIFLPTKYTVLISESDDREFTGIKRDVLINELNNFVERYFNLLAVQYHNSNFIELQISAELQPNGIKILYHWEESYAPNIVIHKPQQTKINFEECDAHEKTIVTNPFWKTEFENGDESDETVVKRNLTKFYTLEIWREGIRQNSLPIFRPEIAIGRGSASVLVDVPLKDDLQISRHHAILNYRTDESFSLSVTGQNPAFVNSQPIFSGQTATLNINSNFRIGSYLLALQQ